MKQRLLVMLLCMCGALYALADPVRDFSLPDTDGHTQTLDMYRGKWVVINYWATNCTPCLQEIPELESFHRRHKDRDAVVLGVNYEDIKLSWLKDFMQSVKMSYPVLLAEPDEVTPFGQIIMLPTTVIVSPAGEVKGMQRGAITAEMLDRYLEQQSADGAGGA